MVAQITRTFSRPVARSDADLLKLSGLEKPQEETLHPQRHLADLVEKHGAAVGVFQLAGLVPVGAGETAFYVAEQLRLEQRLGQAGAVDRDELLANAGTAGVDRPGDQFLVRRRFRR